MPYTANCTLKLDDLTIQRLIWASEDGMRADGVARTWRAMARGYIVKGLERAEEAKLDALAAAGGRR